MVSINAPQYGGFCPLAPSTTRRTPGQTGIPTQSLDTIRFGKKAIAETSWPTFPVANPPNDVYRILSKIPKILLHEHQGGGADIEFLKYRLYEQKEHGRLSDEDRAELGDMNMKRVRDYFRVFRERTQGNAFDGQSVISRDMIDSLREQGLNSYRKTSHRINPLVKTPQAAYSLAEKIGQRAVGESTRYMEYRVSPTGNDIGRRFSEDLSLGKLLNRVQTGFMDAQESLAKGRKFMDYGLIVLFERQGENKVEKAIKLAKEVVDLRKKGYNIVGVDLAGDEINNPPSDFEPAFKIIRDYNEDPATPENKRIGITIHAGETPHSGKLKGWEAIAEAIRVAWSPKTKVRIGHGVQLINSSDILKKAFRAYQTDQQAWEKQFPQKALLEQSPLLREIIEKGIVLEMCPKSNVQTYAVNPFLVEDGVDKIHLDPDNVNESYTWLSYQNHPAVFLSRLGVKVAISSDNRTISNSDATNEFVKLYKHQGATYEDFKRMTMAALDGAFIFDPITRKHVTDFVNDKLGALERGPQNVRALYKLQHQGKPPGRFAALWRLHVATIRQMTYEITHEYWHSLRKNLEV